jgi:pyrroloquinoline-quinone synthase
MRREILDSIIDARCLLKHPFYQAWNMGTLTQENIGLYATQYGEFIDMVAAGWEAAGDTATAQEERVHARLWTDFATGLDVVAVRPAEKRLPEIEELVSLSGTLFSNRAEALGALYAFEQQQPGTAESKLAGLRKHYNVTEKGQVYFDIHKADFEEPRWLAEQIDGLSPEEFARSREACNKMSVALWRGLDGVMSAIG